MNRSMSLLQRHEGRQGFPLQLFATAFVISLLTTIFSGWQMWQMHHRVEVLSDKRADLAEDVGSIMLYDEVLTMSARMAAATGDFSYEKRYDQFDPQLTRKISKLRAILPQTEIAAFVSETDEANNTLVKMERQAFALTHQGRRQEATALLSGAEYLRLKKIYTGGMKKTVFAANDLVKREGRHLEFLSIWFVVASGMSILVILAVWFFAIRSARSWAAERREAEQALRNAQDELVRKEKLAVLGQVAGSVGHELRNPLGVMSNAVYFLQTVLVDADDCVKEYLNIIKSEIDASDRIVTDLLDSVRIRPPHPEVVSVADLIALTLRKCNVPPSVSVQLDIPVTLSPLWVDAMQIHQVLRNLIRNGMDAMPEGGVLEVGAVENSPERTLAISVRDSGSGMTREQLGRLFQPLFTTKARGIGLGLVVVKNLIEANGGRVEVQSEVGLGSTFIVTLPCAS